MLHKASPFWYLFIYFICFFISTYSFTAEGRTSLCAVFCGSPGVTDPESSTLEAFAFDLGFFCFFSFLHGVLFFFIEQRFWRQLPIDSYPPVLFHATALLEDKLFIYGGVDSEEGDYCDIVMEVSIAS